MDTLKRIIASITIFALMGMLAPVSVAQALTADELQAQIVALQATLLELTQQLATIQGTTTPATTFTGCAIASFTRNLAVRSTGDDVKCLQVILNSNADTKVAETGAGSPGNETTYFGAKTKAGVVKFQEKYADTILASYGLTTGTGFVGVTTRAKLNELLDIVVPTTPTTPTTTTTTSTTTTGLTVALASNSPIAGTVVAGQAIADLARFTFTGNNTVTSLKLKRIGVSEDATLSNVYLYDGNTRITDTATVSNGVLTFANASGLFTVNGDKTISVKSDIATGSTGQTVGVALMAATDIVPTVSGNFPINGNTMTVATANLATVVVGTVLPSSNTTVNAGTMNYTVFSAPLTIGVRSINLSNVALKLIGSVTTDALANVKLYINGVQAGTATTIDANGNVAFDLSAAPVVIQSGSATLEVRADVVKGSSRNFSLSLQNVADLVVVDSNYNVNIAATGIPATTATVSVKAGSVAVSLDPTFSVTTVTGGIANAPLAKYSFKAYGEDVKISYLDITPSRNLDNVAL
ncbi:peptidoglycan-binding protein, partial [Patescibacteria group bacterium]|nr:peptidoglycan-binding protein [Patescibacteria group bacterium]